ncbi:MAG: hypothetical protein U9Q82_14515 [Chloroflexota bacterium]|nr:hypothetical protein [Chloroflexota bacterium]
MLESLRAIGGFVLLVSAALIVFFVLRFVLKNMKQLVLVFGLFVFILAIAAGIGAFLGGLIDTKFETGNAFSILFGVVFGTPAGIFGGRWIWENFVQEKEWWPKSRQGD